MLQSILFHGSMRLDLTVLRPFVCDYGRSLVYATPSEAMAAIFINTPGGSLEAAWGFHGETPYYCERVKNVFNKNYEGVEGAIYHLSSTSFHQLHGLYKFEYASETPVMIQSKLAIGNTKDYLVSLQQSNKLVIVPFKDRLDFMPDIEDELIMNCINLIYRFGERACSAIKTYHGNKMLQKVIQKVHTMYSI